MQWPYISVIPNEKRSKVLKDALDNRENKAVGTEDLMKKAGFVLQNNYFEFNGIVKQKISGTAVVTKFAPCLYFHG